MLRHYQSEIVIKITIQSETQLFLGLTLSHTHYLLRTLFLLFKAKSNGNQLKPHFINPKKKKKNPISNLWIPHKFSIPLLMQCFLRISSLIRKTIENESTKKIINSVKKKKFIIS